MRRRDNVIRHVIFDLDGTLIDSCAICVDILSDILADRRSGNVIDPLDARGYMSRGGQDMVAGLLGSACIDPAADLLDFRTRYKNRRTPIGSLFPGVAEGLQRMRDAGLILSICSNKPQNLCDKVLDDTGLVDHFAVVVGSGEALRPKPAPDLLDAVLAQLGARPDDCVFVGDSEIDYQVACDASIAFYFMSYGYAEQGWMPGRAETFDDFQALTRSILMDRVHA